MDVNKTIQAFETDEMGYRRITIDVRTSFVIDPFVDIPDDFIAHALCDNLREYVNSSVISDDVIKVIHEPIHMQRGYEK